MLSVEYAIVPSPAKKLFLEDDATVGDALDVLNEDGISVDGYTMQINGENVDRSTELTNGDIIVMAKKIKGN